MRPHLLDTHVLLWFLGEPDRLSEPTRSLIENRGNRMLVSAATAWEIAIKRALGRLDCPANLEEILADQHFESLSISIAHALEVASLPLHHGDPFDRMLVAQALVEDCTIISRDKRVLQYDVPYVQA